MSQKIKITCPECDCEFDYDPDEDQSVHFFNFQILWGQAKRPSPKSRKNSKVKIYLTCPKGHTNKFIITKD